MAYRQTPAVEFRCARGHRHEPRSDYDIANGHCYCTIRPCCGTLGDANEARIRRYFADGQSMTAAGAECMAENGGSG